MNMFSQLNIKAPYRGDDVFSNFGAFLCVKTFVNDFLTLVVLFEEFGWRICI